MVKDKRKKNTYRTQNEICFRSLALPLNAVFFSTLKRLEYFSANRGKGEKRNVIQNAKATAVKPNSKQTKRETNIASGKREETKRGRKEREIGK